MADAKAGQRFQCGTCGTQVVVIKTEGAPPRCCNTEMLSSPGGATPPRGPGRQAQARLA